MLGSLEQAALRTLLLAATVQLGLGLLRIERPHLRLVAWTVVLAASLAMPALQWATPLRVSVLPSLAGTAVTEAAGPRRQTPMPQAPMPQAPVPETSVPASPEDITTPPTALPWLEALYLLVGGLLLLRLAVGIVLSLRLVGKAAPVRADWATGTRVRISRDVGAPVTVANVVLLPPDAVTWPAATREAVLAHERAHVARRDFAMLLASQVNRAVFWFSPLSWWLHRRLAALAELASDDQAMEVTGDRPGYAAILLEMGRRPGPLARGLAMARPAMLEYRIDRVLGGRLPTAPASPVRQVILAAGAASLSIVAAGTRPYPALPLEQAPVAGQERVPTFADLEPLPPRPAREDLPEPIPMRPLPPPRVEAVSQAAPQPAPVGRAAAAPDSPAVRAAAQPTARTTTRSTPPSPSRTMLQPVRTVRDGGARDGSLKAEMVISGGPAPRSDEGHGIASSLDGLAGADGRAPSSRRTGQPSAGATPLPTRVGEPSCTGVYLPRPGSLRADGSVDFVQATYFQEADGTPWLKLFLGSRTQAKLTGLDVERNSVRTTIVTTLPRGTTHVTGTTRGTYGTIDFECVGSNAHL